MARHDMRGLKNSKTNEEDNVEEQEETAWGERFKNLRDKLKLGSHHKMERFTILLSSTLAFLLVFTVLSFVSHRSDMASQASTQAMYTDSFTFSLSGQSMSVEGVYGNKNNTDVMVLLKMADPSAMSTDADNYDLFITGKNGSMSYKPDVSFSLFGATGYGIIRFQNETPMAKEVLNVTIRANSQLTSGDNTAPPDDKVVDGSFQKYDQGTLYVNPGADGIKVLNELKTGEDDPAKLYIALVADEKDNAIHDKIKTKTKKLENLLDRAKEYKNRLVSSGYEPPKTPWFVKGDYVDDEGVFRPANNVANAHVINYYTKDIHDGYLNQVMSDLSEYDEYMKKHSGGSVDAADTKDARKEQVTPVTKLTHKDGSTLKLSEVATGSSPSAQVAAKSAVRSLESTWSTYIGVKAEIQRGLMHDLLVLDADVQSQPSMFSKNDDKDSVIIY